MKTWHGRWGRQFVNELTAKAAWLSDITRQKVGNQTQYSRTWRKSKLLKELWPTATSTTRRTDSQHGKKLISIKCTTGFGMPGCQILRMFFFSTISVAYSIFYQVYAKNTKNIFLKCKQTFWNYLCFCYTFMFLHVLFK